MASFTHLFASPLICVLIFAAGYELCAVGWQGMVGVFGLIVAVAGVTASLECA